MQSRNKSKYIQLSTKIHYCVDFKRFSDLCCNANYTASLYFVVLYIKFAS